MLAQGPDPTGVSSVNGYFFVSYVGSGLPNGSLPLFGVQRDGPNGQDEALMSATHALVRSLLGFVRSEASLRR